MAELVRMAPGTRRFLQIAGVALFLLGNLLFLSNFFLESDARPGDADFQERADAEMRWSTIRALAGMALFLIGGTMMGFGFRKPLAELAATDTERAVEHSSRHLGRGLGAGLKESGVATGSVVREVVRVRCPSCGRLDSEDARYCSSCGKPM